LHELIVAHPSKIRRARLRRADRGGFFASGVNGKPAGRGGGGTVAEIAVPERYCGAVPRTLTGRRTNVTQTYARLAADLRDGTHGILQVETFRKST
jgi:hypothetical protein